MSAPLFPADLTIRVDQALEAARFCKAEAEVVLSALLAMRSNPSLCIEDALKAGMAAQGIEEWADA
jgi:hypothetical protein